jgi:hypothetical protein
MTRLRGRTLRGKRLVAAAPHGHWDTSTFLAGLRHDGLVAPAVFNGAINGQAFRAYVEQALAPTLSVGDVVVLDNLTSHKVREAWRLRRRKHHVGGSTVRPARSLERSCAPE